MADIYKTLSSPLKVQIELTHNCDSRCLHCYNSRFSKNHIGITLTKNQIDIIVNELVNSHVPSVTITGGEPLLYKENLYYLLEKLKSNNIAVGLNSNLNLLDAKTAEILKNYGINSILTSCISFDPNVHDMVTQHKGSHEKMINGIRAAIASKIEVTVNMVISQYNENQIFETGKFAHKLGAKTFTATKATPPAGDNNFKSKVINSLVHTLDELLRVHDNLGINVDILECYPLCAFPNDTKYSDFAKHSCTAGITSCMIGADGEIRPCAHGFQTYGNIFKNTLNDIWLKMSDWRSGKYIPSTCKNCVNFVYCTGGCRMEAYASNGNLSSMDPWANPLNKELVNLLPKNEIEIIDADKSLSLADSIIYRKEKYGFIISRDKYKHINVGDDAGNLLKELSKRNSFTINNVSSEYNIPIEQVSSFFSALFTLSIIKYN